MTQEQIIEQIKNEWKDFARSKIFMFRCVPEVVFNAYYDKYITAIISRSEVFTVIKNEILLAWLLVEDVKDSNNTKIVHACFTNHHARNHGYQKELWANLMDKNIFITHLSVVAEKMLNKHPNWLFNPFLLTKETL